jgi:hypothetical protein
MRIGKGSAKEEIGTSAMNIQYSPKGVKAESVAYSLSSA